MGAIILLIIVVFLAVVIYSRLPLKPEQVIPELKEKNAVLIYLDSDTKKVFASKTYKIKAKPDFLYKMPDDSYIIVEYKSRSGSVKNSDIAQLIATAIAVKETYPTLYTGYIYTQGRHIKKIDLKPSANQLFESIKQEVHQVRQIEAGRAPAFQPKKEHCQVCVLRRICEFRYQ